MIDPERLKAMYVSVKTRADDDPLEEITIRRVDLIRLMHLALMKSVPGWAVYISVNANGDVFAHDHKPESFLKDGIWKSSGISRKVWSTQHQEKDWTNKLVKWGKDNG